MEGFGSIRSQEHPPVSAIADARAIAHHLQRIAREQGLPVPGGFRFLSYVQGKYSSDVGGNNIRACIDLLPDALRRFKPKSNTAAPAAA